MPGVRDRTTRAEDLEVLSKVPIFSALNAEDRAQVLAHSRQVVLSARDVLWLEGQKAEHLGIVLSGRLSVVRQQRRRDVIVDVAGPGDVLGEVALTLKATYQFQVRCFRRARVMLVPTHTLRAILERRPALAVALSLDLARQVLRLTRHVEALSAGGVEQRIARVLVSLTERFGEPFPGGILVPVRLRREDLASLAATTLESASRHVSAWQKKGWIVQQPSGVLVKDLAAIKRSAEG